MKLPIIGLPSSGKTTVFRALTGAEPQAGDARGAVSRTVFVPDERIDWLSGFYHPEKTTYASVEYVDLGRDSGMTRESTELGPRFLDSVRPASVLVHVVDAFVFPGEASVVTEAIEVVDTELALADLAITQKRLDRLRREARNPTGAQAEEVHSLEQAEATLSDGKPLRLAPELTGLAVLRNFNFLTAKPIITVLNTAESGPEIEIASLGENVRLTRSGPAAAFISLCGQLEADIATLPPAEARAFLQDYGISTPARDRVIQKSYDLLGLMSFFTVGEDEVRAWTLSKGETALDAARAIHSDLARGFIAAEVIDYDSVVALGGFEVAKRKGKVRLEGKGYLVQDGDVISIRYAI